MNAEITALEWLPAAEGEYFLRRRLGEGEQYAAYMQDWLQLYGRERFLQWTVQRKGSLTECYADTTGALTLPDFIKQAQKPETLSGALLDFCDALALAEDSLIDPRRINLAPELIFFLPDPPDKRGRPRLKLFLLPVLSAAELPGRAAYEQSVQKILRLLLDALTDKRRGKRQRAANAALLAAAAEGTAALRKQLQSQQRGSRSRGPFRRLRPPARTGRGGSAGTAECETVPAAAENRPAAETGGRPRKADERGEKAGRTAARCKRNLPLLLVLAEACILAVIFMLDRFFSPYSLRLLLILTGLLALCCLWQFFLILWPASPYCILRRKSRFKAVADTAVRTVGAESEPALHPLARQRTAVLSLLNKPLKDGTLACWQIIADEFLVGGDPERCNLCLEGIGEDNPLVLRISQRAGVFTAQALSSTESVYLEERLLYRYEDYLLPDECRLRIKHLIFRFRAY